MLQEVYYKNYKENRNGDYRKEPRSIPYLVTEKDRDVMESFHDFLIDEGYECVTWNLTFHSVLVNTELRRFGMIHLPTYFECVDSRRYTIKEFLDEVYYSN